MPTLTPATAGHGHRRRRGRHAATLATATFTDANKAAPAGDFTVTAVSWGDGSTGTAGLTVSGSGGNYTVNGSHLYAEEGATTSASP